MPRQSSDSTLLFIMRHGEAEPARRDDRQRQLTDNGRLQSLATSEWLEKYSQHQTIDMALVSPYRRTKQTFEMMQQHHRFLNNQICNDIVPDGDIHLTHDYIDALLQQSRSRLKPLRSILLVSHMPFVSYLLDEICQIQRMPLFATASVAVVNYSGIGHRGELLEHYQGR
ncbi:phosphohistidine phosphatase SixA [Salinimonas iocasae]|uniref:Phosphohistidine phosphatase SixA n=1 Tax=Salinimonas iocasae TaxID=2572577 RepID=A0A5B7YEL2_9ALTE|nr:phosphohistidine phosphatase SixA [Salinimonas iocasae]QCZ94104.1 phosphohistidine phosphatase SixA [Salinimonas iocasae]